MGFLLLWLLFLIAEHGLWCEGSGVVAQGLSYPATRGILVSQRGIKPVSPALAGRFLATGPPGKFRFFISLSLSFFFFHPFALSLIFIYALSCLFTFFLFFFSSSFLFLLVESRRGFANSLSFSAFSASGFLFFVKYFYILQNIL